jgi:integrase
VTRARDEGSVYRRKDGRWVAALRWPGGKRKYRYARTQRAAAVKLGELVALRAAGQPAPNDQITIGAILDLWLTQHVSKLSASTRESYGHQVEAYIRPELGKLKAATLIVSRLSVWREELLERGVPPATVSYGVLILRTVLTWAMREDLVARNVATLVERPKYRKKQRKPLTAGEATDLLAAVRGHRMHAFIVLALTSALRRGELLGLTWGAIHEQEAYLEVLQQAQRVKGRGIHLVPTKTERSEAPVAITKLFLDALKVHRRRLIEERVKAGPLWRGHDNPVAPDALVFPSRAGTPMEGTNAWREWRDVLVEAKIEHRPLHGTRHTTATLLRALHVPMEVIQDVLRHSSKTTTKGYAHGDLAEQHAAAAKLDELLGGVLG